MSKSNDLSAVEGIKTRSRQLRGTIAEGLTDQITGAISDDDTQLINFHGSYQQDDRDLRAVCRRARAGRGGYGGGGLSLPPRGDAGARNPAAAGECSDATALTGCLAQGADSLPHAGESG